MERTRKIQEEGNNTASVREEDNSDSTKKEISVASFAGPLPPPDIMAGYNEAVPNGAERIMKMAESQSNHIMKMENKGQWFAFILGILGLIGAVIVGIFGSPWVGVTIGGGTLVILVVAFLKGSFIKE